MGQGPNAVEVVGQQDNGIDMEGVMPFDMVERLTKQVNGFICLEQRLTVVGDNGKKIAGTRRCGAAILHGGNVLNAVLG